MFVGLCTVRVNLFKFHTSFNVIFVTNKFSRWCLIDTFKAKKHFIHRENIRKLVYGNRLCTDWSLRNNPLLCVFPYLETDPSFTTSYGQRCSKVPSLWAVTILVMVSWPLRPLILLFLIVLLILQNIIYSRECVWQTRKSVEFSNKHVNSKDEK